MQLYLILNVKFAKRKEIREEITNVERNLEFVFTKESASKRETKVLKTNAQSADKEIGSTKKVSLSKKKFEEKIFCRPEVS